MASNSAIPVEKHMNQLQFNLRTVPKAFSLETNFQKPKPIVIEKLQPMKAKDNDNERHGRVSLIRSSSSLSSDRLELAMQLAKRDVKKLKNMLADPHIDISGFLGNNGGNVQDAHQITDRKVDDGKRVTKYSAMADKSAKESRNREKKPSIGKVVTTIHHQDNTNKKKTQLQFYDLEDDANEKSLKSQNPKTREMSEIKRLRKELQKYMKRLDVVLEQKDTELKDADLIKRKTHFEEDTEHERKEHRAEEQAARSARVLYMLQRKVQEIQDELEAQQHQIRHTKKSQSLTRLAAAHRAAVRALQMFVNQAPLYYDLKHGLPPMYNELGLLIQQLSLLSSHFDADKDLPDFDLDMLPRTKELIASWNQKSKMEPKAEATKNQRKQIQQKQSRPSVRKSRFQDQYKEMMNKRISAIDQRNQRVLETTGKSNEPTPEREAAMQAGIDALERARDSASFISQDVEKKQGGLKFNVPIKTGKTKAKSVFAPHRLKRNKQPSFRVNRVQRPMTTRRVPPGQEMGFAKQTVSSVLKQQPGIAYEPKKVKVRSPNRNEIPEGVHVTFGTPKQRDKEILKMASPRSPKERTISDAREPSAVRFIDFNERESSPRRGGISEREATEQVWESSPRRSGISEREAARQVWLDRERDREMRRLHALRQKEEGQLKELSDGYAKARDIVDAAEMKIKTQLQPLLEKAELMSVQEKMREDQYKLSVRRRLADIVTETAMSRGELLADLILDDILIETVQELQRIEDEENAQTMAAFEQDKPTLENIEQRLAAFEEEEEQIRRRWKQLHYSELDLNNDEILVESFPKTQTKAENQRVDRDKNDGGIAKPIIFTSVATRYESPYVKEQKYLPKGLGAVMPDVQHTDMKIPFFISDAMKASIFSYQRQHERYLMRTITEEHGTFNPWQVIEKVSDEIVDELVSEVEKELEDFWDEYIEKAYKEEFLKNDSTISEVSNQTL